MSFLGTKVSDSKVESILKSLNCKVEMGKSKCKVIPPTYRNDLHIKEDIAEEIARSIGYDEIPSTVPPLSTPPLSGLSDSFDLIQKAKDVLSQMGCSEAVHYSFASGASFERLGLKPSVKVENPMSADQEWMVPSLIPGLLGSVSANLNHHHGTEPLPIRLYELRPTFKMRDVVKAHSKSDTGIEEEWRLSLAFSGPRHATGLKPDFEEVDFYDLKALIEQFLERMEAKKVRIGPYSGETSLYHPGKSASVLMGRDSVGEFGLLHPGIAKKLKIKVPVWIAELDWSRLSSQFAPARSARQFKMWSEFPAIERDFALVVGDQTQGGELTQIARKEGGQLVKSVRVFDVYKGEQVASGKASVAVRVVFAEKDRSLKAEEVDGLSEKIVAKWKKDLGAELR